MGPTGGTLRRPVMGIQSFTGPAGSSGGVALGTAVVRGVGKVPTLRQCWLGRWHGWLQASNTRGSTISERLWARGEVVGGWVVGIVRGGILGLAVASVGFGRPFRQVWGSVCGETKIFGESGNVCVAVI